MADQVLITGGSGLVGSRLTELLLEKGYKVAHLGRKPEGKANVTDYLWDIEQSKIDEKALTSSNHIIHLAGAGIADKAWSEKRKNEIIDSRVKGAELILNKLKTTKHLVKTFVSASAIGIYGNTGDISISEESPKGNDFLAKTCVIWEKAADEFAGLGLRVVKIRTGLVLSKKGGALPQLALPVKFGIGSPYGSGEQFMPWIHIDDLCNIYIKAIEDTKMEGAYNSISPHPVRNKEMIKTLGKVLNRPVFFPNIPSFVLRLILGERAIIVLYGSNVSSKKITKAGYNFKYPFLIDALTSIYRK